MPATPYADLPIMSDRQRSYQEADVMPRVRAWASSDGSGDPAKIDYAKFRQAFLWWDPSKPNEIGSYRLKIADVVDGKLVAVWRGITTIADVMQGGRGGTTIPDADRPAVMEQVQKYYAKAAKVFDDASIHVPWMSRSAEQVQPVQISSIYRRRFDLDSIEVVSRAQGGDGRTVSAYAAVFEQPAVIHDQFGDYIETIDPKAFNRTISNGAVKTAKVLLNHGFDLYGRTGGMQQVPLGHPIKIEADRRGVLTVSRYNQGPLTEQVLAGIKNGDYRAQSFSGTTYRSTPAAAPGRARPGQQLPKIRRLELGLSDYGPTTDPAYPDAEITAVRTARDVEEYLYSLTDGQRHELFVRTSDASDAERSATPDPGPGAEDPRTAAHSHRLRLLRLRAELTLGASRRA